MTASPTPQSTGIAAALQRFDQERNPVGETSSIVNFTTSKGTLTVEQQIASYEKMFLELMADKSQFYGKMSQLGMRPTYNTQINGLMRGLTFNELKGQVNVKTNAGAEWQASDKSADERLKIITEKLNLARDLVSLSKEDKAARAASSLHARVTGKKVDELHIDLTTKPSQLDPTISQPAGVKTVMPGGNAQISPPIFNLSEPKTPVDTSTVKPVVPLPPAGGTGNATSGSETGTTPGSGPKTEGEKTLSADPTVPLIPEIGPARDKHVDFASISSVLDTYGLKGEWLRRNELQINDLDQALYFNSGGMLIRSRLFDAYNTWVDTLDNSKSLGAEEQKAAREKATETFTKNVEGVLQGSDTMISQSRRYGLIGSTYKLMASYANVRHDAHLTTEAIRKVAEANGLQLDEEDFLLRNEDGFKILQLTLETDGQGKGNQQRLTLYNHFTSTIESSAKTNDGRAKDKSLGWKERIEALSAWKAEELTKIGENEVAKARLETEFQKRAKSITDEFRSEVVAVVRDASGLPKERHGADKFFHDLGEFGKKVLKIAPAFIPGVGPLGIGAAAIGSR